MDLVISKPKLEMKLQAFTQSPSSNNTISLDLPVGKKFHELFLVTGTMVLADFAEIRTLVNGNILQRVTGTELNYVNIFDKQPAYPANNNLHIPFNRRTLKSELEEDETALNTGSRDKNGKGIETFRLEIDLGAAVNPAATIQGYATVSEGDAGGAGTISYCTKNIVPITGAGDWDITTMFNKGNASQLGINRIHFHPDANAITRMRARINSTTDVWDRTDALNRDIQTAAGVRTQQGGYYTMDKSERGYGDQVFGLVGLQDFRVIVTTTGAMNLTVITEYIGTLQS